MKRNRVFVIVVMLLLMTAGFGYAQVTDEETPLYLQTMTAAMIRDGLPEYEVGEFEQACLQFQWENLEGVDPQVLMLAFRYAWEHGDPAGDPAQARAEVAYELSLQAKTMQNLGIDERTMARIAVGATRQVFNVKTEEGDTLRTRLRETTQLLLRDRVRENDPQGQANRYGEDAQPGVPPAAPGVGPEDRGPQAGKN